MPVKKWIFDEVKKLSAKDHLVEWQKPKRKPVWMTGEAYANLPDTITLREFSVKGMDLLRCKTPEMVEKEIAVHVFCLKYHPRKFGPSSHIT